MVQLKLMKKANLWSAIALITLSFILIGQACTRTVGTSESSTLSLAPKESEFSGNGGGYEGKPRIYHFDKEMVSCSGQEVPKSILIYYEFTNSWYLVENENETCSSLNRKTVQDVQFDSNKNTATFNSLTYTPPKAYLVDPLANPDNSDVIKDDGICRDIAGRCSLRAAIEQASITTFTEDVNVLIPAGNYKISKGLILDGAPLFSKIEQRNHKILIAGEGGRKSIIDGNLITNILSLQGVFYDLVEVKGLGFTNGKYTATDNIYPAIDYLNSRYNAEGEPFEPYFNIIDCIFSNNIGREAVRIKSHYGNVKISNSVFENNLGGGLSFDTLLGNYVVESSIFRGNYKYGMVVTNSSAFVHVRNSLFYDNKGVGYYLGKCVGCDIDNSIFYNNESYGLSVLATGKYNGIATGSTDLIVKNSTIYNNGVKSGGNLDITFYGPARTVLMYNSVIAMDNPAKKNCVWTLQDSGYTHNLSAFNSIITDTTCEEIPVNVSRASPEIDPTFSVTGEFLGLLPKDTSPLIDQGDNSKCSATDALGNRRPVDFLGHGIICDIGAYEKQH